MTEITNGTINGALRRNKKRQPGSRLKTSDRILRYIRAGAQHEAWQRWDGFSDHLALAARGNNSHPPIWPRLVIVVQMRLLAAVAPVEFLVGRVGRCLRKLIVADVDLIGLQQRLELELAPRNG